MIAPPPSWHDLPGIIRALNRAGEAALARRLAHCWRRLERLLTDEAEDAPEYDPTLTRFAALKFKAFDVLTSEAAHD